MPTNIVDTATARYVEVKESWDSPWTSVDYLTPVSADVLLGPDIGTATFRYDFGRIIRENTTTAQDFEPLDLLDQYVRITVDYETQGPVVVWVGIITDESTTYVSPAAVTGYQEYTARELGYILDRIIVSDAYAESAGSVTERVRIEVVPDFNARGKSGAVYGNKTSSTYEFGTGKSTPIFGRQWNIDSTYETTRTWNADEAIDYLFKAHLFDQPFAYTSTTLIEGLVDVWKQEGRSIWRILSDILDRRNGFVFYLDSDGGDGDITLVVNTVTKDAITTGSHTIPANTDQTNLELPTAQPFTHLFGPLTFRRSTVNKYDTYEAIGEPILCTGTFTFAAADGLIQKGWSDELETEYKAGGDGSGYELKDTYRSDDKFDTVYGRFEVKSSWDGTIQSDPFWIRVNDDGTVNEGPDDGFPALAYTLMDVRFERNTPFEYGVDYTASTPTLLDGFSASDYTDSIGYVPMIGVLYDNTDGDLHEKTERYCYLDRLNEANENLTTNVNIGPLSSCFGFKVTASPRHYLAAGDMTESDGETRALPEISWKDIEVTASAYAPFRVRYKATAPGVTTPDIAKKFTVYIRDAELHHITPSTVVGVDEDGNALEYGGTSDFIRDDRPQLKTIVGSAMAWYGVTRQVVTIPIYQLQNWASIGQMLVDITGWAGTFEVGTVISRISYTFDDPGMVTIVTGFGDYDYVPDLFRLR